MPAIARVDQYVNRLQAGGVGADQHHDWQAAASALAWWAEAGVDTLVDAEPRDWLAGPVALPPPAARAAADALPADWTAFAAWRSGTAAPEHDWPGAWIAASGPATAQVMVMVDCPDPGDFTHGCLLSGEIGRLFERMLAAIGLSREGVHLASLCAKRPTAGRLPREAEARLAAVARHHIALVGPRAVLLMGNAASRAILSTDVAAARGNYHPFNHSEGEATQGPRVVASYHPRTLIERPAIKAAAWADLRMLRRVMGE